MRKFLGQVVYLLTQVNTWLVAAATTVAAAATAVATLLDGPGLQVVFTVGSVTISALVSSALVVRRSLTISNDPGARFVPSSKDQDYKHQYDSTSQDW